MKKLKLCLLGLAMSITSISVAQHRKSFNSFLAESISSNQKNTKLESQSKTSASYTPGRSVNYNWSQALNNWFVNDTSLFVYNSEGLVIEKVSRNGYPISRTQMTYDSKGRLIQSIHQTWLSFMNQWENSYRNIQIYDLNDNLIENRNDFFNSTSNQWQISSGDKNVITYNSSNYMVSNIYQTWNSSSLSWKDYLKIIYLSHTGNGAPTLYEMQNKVGTAWVNNARITDTYSIFGELVEEMNEWWDSSAYKKKERYTNFSWHKWTGDMNTSAIGSFTTQIWGSPNANQWNTKARHISTYDSYGGRVATFQEYINAVWRNHSRDSYLYDGNFNATGFRQELWLTSFNSWKIYSEQKITHFYAFGGSGQITKSIWQQWNPTSMTFENDRKEEYSDFVLISGLSEQSNSISSEILIFPNPFNSFCTLKFVNQVPSNEHAFHFQLFDVFGKLVSETNITEHETRIEKGDLSPGIYFYSVMDQTSSVAKGKLVVE